MSLNDLDRRQHGKEFVNTRFQVYDFVANVSDSEERFVFDRVLRVWRCAHSHSRLLEPIWPTTLSEAAASPMVAVSSATTSASSRPTL